MGKRYHRNPVTIRCEFHLYGEDGEATRQSQEAAAFKMASSTILQGPGMISSALCDLN